MPSISHHQLAAAQARWTNDRLTDTSYNNGFYLVIDSHKKSDGSSTISVNPKVEPAVKDTELSENIAMGYAGLGSGPATRTEIQEGSVNLNAHIKSPYAPSRRLLTMGAVVTLVDPEGNEAIPLHIRNGNVPLAGKITNPSGLASERPEVALWKRLNQEAGYFSIDQDAKTITAIIFEADEHTKKVHPQLMDQITNEKMKNQRAIRVALTAATGINVTNTDDWSMSMVRCDSTLTTPDEDASENMISKVAQTGALAEVINTDGKGVVTVTPSQPISAHVHDDQQRQTLTLTVPLTTKIPFALNDLVCVDPEGYGRKVALFSQEDFRKLGDPASAVEKNGVSTFNDGVPALNEYVRRLNGAPEPTVSVKVAPAPAAAPAVA